MMKSTSHFLFATSFLLLSCNTDDNDVVPSDVPEAVKSTLSTNFSNALNVEWEKVGDDYAADFEVAGVDYEAVLSPTGVMLRYKHDILATELPDAVTAAISQNHSDNQIDDAERLYQGNDAFYQVELDNGSTELHLVFSPDGQEQSDPAYWD